MYYTPRSILPGELVIRKICCLREERVPTICERASAKAVFHYIGIVKEFRIEMKTLDEIKTGDDSQCFYMPSHNTISPKRGIAVNLSKSDINSKSETADTATTIILEKANELRCTSFCKLRENPNVLIQQLHPKSTMLPFFINSMAHGGGPYKLSSSTSIRRKYSKTGVATAFDPTTSLPSVHNRLSVSPQTFKFSQLQTAVDSGVLQSLPMNRRRRPPACQVGPCGRRDLEPKVRMFKTVAVGIIQIAVFLVLIMALTYPDIRC